MYFWISLVPGTPDSKRTIASTEIKSRAVQILRLEKILRKEIALNLQNVRQLFVQQTILKRYEMYLIYFCNFEQNIYVSW